MCTVVAESAHALLRYGHTVDRLASGSRKLLDDMVAKHCNARGGGARPPATPRTNKRPALGARALRRFGRSRDVTRGLRHAHLTVAPPHEYRSVDAAQCCPKAAHASLDIHS